MLIPTLNQSKSELIQSKMERDPFKSRPMPTIFLMHLGLRKENLYIYDMAAKSGLMPWFWFLTLPNKKALIRNFKSTVIMNKGEVKNRPGCTRPRFEPSENRWNSIMPWFLKFWLGRRKKPGIRVSTVLGRTLFICWTNVMALQREDVSRQISPCRVQFFPSALYCGLCDTLGVHFSNTQLGQKFTEHTHTRIHSRSFGYYELKSTNRLLRNSPCLF